MTPQEAQQAQTIDTIKRAHRIAKLRLSSQGVEPLGISAHLDRGALLEIVDSRAQKIAEQTKALYESETRNIKLNQQNDKLRDALAEQAKEIEQLQSQYSAMVQTNRQRG